MNKKTMLIIGGIAGVLVLCVCIVAAGIVVMNMGKTGETVKVVSTQAALVVVENTAQPEQAASTATSAPTEPATPAPTVANTAEPAAIDSSEAKQIANELLAHLSDNEYDQAVSLTDSTLRSAAGTPDQLREIVEEKNLNPIIWEWLKVDEDSEKQEVYLDGVVNYAEDRRGTVTAHLRVEDGNWKVFFLDMQTKGDSTDPGAYSEWSEARKNEEVAFAKGSADFFLIDWADDDYASAYEYSASALKFEVGSQEKLAEILRALGVHPDNWSWDDWSAIELETLDQPVIELTGAVDYQEGKSGPITIQLAWEKGYWSVMYFNVKAE